jgi:hypothetical protein
MCVRKVGLAAIVFAVTVLAADLAWGLGFRLGQTKEQLKLNYDVSSVDHGTGRVTINLMIADEGRLKPLTSVDLFIPGEDGTDHVDLWVPLATRKSDGKLLVDVHLKREWAERAEIHLKTLGSGWQEAAAQLVLSRDPDCQIHEDRRSEEEISAA